MTSIDFFSRISGILGGPLTTRRIHTFQVNIGLKCNQHCTHCHHQAGPERDEMMSWDTMKVIIEKARIAGIPTIDITGGAPEMHPKIREFITGLKKNGHHVMLRTNLTALLEEGNRDLPGFYRDNGLELIASLPCYEKDEVDCVRGEGVFKKSLEALGNLNELGFGIDPKLRLDLVFNPMADFLPPPQKALKEEYKDELDRNFGIRFTDLFTITNMPMGRFLEDLKRDDREDGYMELLKNSFNPTTIDNLMCLFQINIKWDGTLYDCDFNQAMGIPTGPDLPRNIRDIDPDNIPVRKVATGDHCFGCTAGAGSSCGGALVD
ncbi:MAG: arsenosugar biosynthesis radical SAM protein ArsS [Candidatus Thermoplasmatota archaeon]|nr:arsenosugar biosynthesis radical SAM protein ArsS [Candidatus Thermoplasmatota archaeon]